MEKGVYQALESSRRPVSIPAWTSSMNIKDPGQLGHHGFLNRKDYKRIVSA